jgi:prepilin-type processing-associated H-X9-DG protein
MTEAGRRSLRRMGLFTLAAIIAYLVIRPLTTHEPLPRRVRCGLNLKQLGLAIAMYADLYDGRCPVDSTNPTLIGSIQLLSNISSTAKFLYCPSDSRPGARVEPDFRKLTTNNISYSYVPNQIWSTNQKSGVIIALDRIYATEAGSLWQTNSNHKGQGGNILFNDGHVEFKTRLPSDLKDKDGNAIVLSP